MRKKIFAVVVSAALALSLIPLAFAEDEPADQPLPVSDIAAEPGLFGRLMSAESVDSLLALMEAADAEALEALSTDEIDALFGLVDALDPTGGTEAAMAVVDMLIALPGFVSGAEQDGEGAAAYAAWDGSSANGNFTIDGDVKISKMITIGEGQVLTLTGSGTIKRAAGYAGAFFKLTGNGKLVIKGEGSGKDIIIDGGNNWTKAASPEVSPTPDPNGVIAGEYGNFVRMAGAETVVQMENVTMQNNWLDGNAGTKRSTGAAINIADDSAKEVTLTNCTIQKMYAAYGGAAVFSDGKTAHTVTFENCIVRDCVIWYDRDNAGTHNDGNEGGAFRTNGGTACTLVVDNTIFEGNMSSGMGAGIYFNSGGGSATVRNGSRITGNEAATYGGGLMVMTQINLESATISGNSARYGGGIAYRPFNSGSPVTSYYKPGTTELRDALQNGSMNLGSGVEISSNQATAMGGGLYIEVGNARFNTQSEVEGWSVFGTKMELAVNGAVVEGNSAEQGGAIYMAAVEFSKNGTVSEMREDVVSSLKFNSGTLKGNTAADGGGVYLKGIPVTIGSDGGKTVIEGNEATSGNGGAFYVDNSRKLLSQDLAVAVQNATIEGNRADSGKGGAIYVTGETTIPTTLSSSTVSGNSAVSGGAVCIEGGGLAMLSGTVRTNAASQNGGAAYVSGGDFSMSGGSVVGNSAKNGGGAYVTGGDFSMSGGTVGGDTAASANKAENGGAVYMAGGNFMMAHGAVSGNSATKNGGAVYMAGESAVFTMESGKMSNNKAKDDGGAVYAAGGELYIGLSGCSGEGNEKHTAKGAARHHPEMTGNEAADTGGAIAVGGAGNVHLYCGDVKGNEALYEGVGYNVFMTGGKVYLHAGADVGVPENGQTNPGLVIVGGTLHEGEQIEDGKAVTLKYYPGNDSATTSHTGVAELGERMNLPDGTYFFGKKKDYEFLGWTPKGKASAEGSEYVRAKGQYLASGDPVTVTDEKAAGESQGTYDGASDGVMNLYALWAPKTSGITYAGYMIEGEFFKFKDEALSAADNPKTYSFEYSASSLNVKAPTVSGYELVGWYIYQNEGQNANWGLEPTPLGVGDDYASLDYSKLTYLEVTNADDSLDLAVEAMTFGDITLIAKYEPIYGTVEITKAFPEGAAYSIDADQPFVFRITGETDDEALPAVDMDVVVYAGQKVTVKLPAGDYRIVEDESWAWRWACDDAEQKVDIAKQGDKSQLSFTNEQETPYWLNYFGSKLNVFEK